MNQEQIGKRIKEIRTKNKLSQSAFAKKYGVTYQAVSKWETGKNIPDISILKQICKDYKISLEELINGEEKSNPNKHLFIIAFILIAIITISVIVLIASLNTKKDEFEFKTLSSISEEFKLSGSIAYNQDKTSIYISEVTYNGEDKDTEYKKIESTLYEIEDNTKTSISTYNKTFLITLDEFLNSMTFNVDNHPRICEKYTEESLLIEILATTKKDKVIKYEIPILISENCQKE